MNVIVVGGVAGGASTAARLRRLSEEANITIFEKGGYVSFANCGLPYYIGGEVQQWDSLQVTSPKRLRQRFNLDVHTHKEVVSIDRAEKTVKVKDVVSGEQSNHSYDHLVLSVGCEAIVPRAIPGIMRPGHFTLKTLEDTTAIEQHIAAVHPRRIVICGGGFIGLEIAEQLVLRGFRIAMVEAMDQVMAPLDPEMAEYLHDLLRAKGVDLHLSDAVASFDEPAADKDGTAARASDVILKSGARLPADMVVLALGVRPSTAFVAAAGLELTPRGHIKVDERMQTITDPCIWAVGDAVEVRNSALGGDETWAVALGGPANRQGRLCADNILGRKGACTYRGTIGANGVQMFGLTAAGVGVQRTRSRPSRCQSVISLCIAYRIGC
jgi:NADPH-dependent 2,4-dienoyl-CoA reductase/sulfur reductase-like enzyme